MATEKPATLGRHEVVSYAVKRLVEMLGFEVTEFNPGSSAGPDLLVQSPSGAVVVIEVEDAYAQGQDKKWQARAESLGQPNGPSALIVVGPSSHYREFRAGWESMGRRGYGRDLFVLHDDSWERCLPAVLARYL